MTELAPKVAATLGAKGHVYCAGTLAQCIYRWKRLAPDKQAEAFLKIGRDGIRPTIFSGEGLAELGNRRDLLEEWMR